MLKVINLCVIQSVFNQFELTDRSVRSFYVECLIRYFGNKKATTQNNVAFELRLLEETRNANIDAIEMLVAKEMIEDRVDRLFFRNTWFRYIDRDLLDKSEEKKTGINKHADELRNSKALAEMCRMKLKISEQKYKALVEEFISSQQFKNDYRDASDCLRHCYNWMQKNANKVPEGAAKSKSKMLGGN